MQELSELLIVLGVVIVLIGVALLIAGRIPFLGRLPGDFSFSWDGVTCLFPLASSILLSVLLTILVNIVLRLNNK